MKVALDADPINGGHKKATISTTPIKKVEVKASTGTWSSMPANTRYHDAELVMFYSINRKTLYAYYFDEELKKYVKVWSRGDNPLNFRLIKLVPGTIKVIDYNTGAEISQDQSK